VIERVCCICKENWEHSFGVCLWKLHFERHLIETIKGVCAYAIGVQKGL
jgi:hypothetical protein